MPADPTSSDEHYTASGDEHYTAWSDAVIDKVRTHLQLVDERWGHHVANSWREQILYDLKERV